MISTPDSYFSATDKIGLIHGDSFDIMREMVQANLKFGAIVTDPPYSSGGLTSQDRRKNPVRKYHQNSTEKQFPSFANDMRDMRTHYFWTVDWLRLALQVAGWTYRGMAVWDKTDGTRPQRGLFLNQCEYIHVASNGDMPPMADRPNKYAPGCFRVPPRPFCSPLTLILISPPPVCGCPIQAYSSLLTLIHLFFTCQ